MGSLLSSESGRCGEYNGVVHVVKPTHDVLAKCDGSVSRGGRWTVGAPDWQVLAVECLYFRMQEQRHLVGLPED